MLNVMLQALLYLEKFIFLYDTFRYRHLIRNIDPRASFMIVPPPAAVSESEAAAEASILLKPELTPEQKLAAQCYRKQIVSFDEVYPEDILANSRKIGEGAFGEVFLLGASGPDRPVLKVVPVGGDVKVLVPAYLFWLYNAAFSV